VALRVEHRTSDQELTGSTPAQVLLCNNLRQVVHTLVPPSPSTISWYQCKDREGNGRLWKRCGLLYIILSVSPLPVEDQYERRTLKSQSCAIPAIKGSPTLYYLLHAYVVAVDCMVVLIAS